MRELRAIAREQGAAMRLSEGGNHTKVHIDDRLIIVPRHREINELTARGILRRAQK